MQRTRLTTLAATVATATLLLAACGGSSETATESAAPAASAAPTAAPAEGGAASGEPIVIGMPIAQSGPAGIADHKDCWNGAILAQETINANGGVNGRPIELDVTDIDILTPEGITAQLLRCGDLDAVRAAIPSDRTNLGRSEGDPDSIVEVWL